MKEFKNMLVGRLQQEINMDLERYTESLDWEDMEEMVARWRGLLEMYAWAIIAKKHEEE